mmetsp:Transcript_19462/g.51196  ORF Transcript_19462/g.51196 Transcript_19462/m.51196 type:complete len:233 (-) Transcript_19462:1568-2266(-)
MKAAQPRVRVVAAHVQKCCCGGIACRNQCSPPQSYYDHMPKRIPPACYGSASGSKPDRYIICLLQLRRVTYTRPQQQGRVLLFQFFDVLFQHLDFLLVREPHLPRRRPEVLLLPDPNLGEQVAQFDASAKQRSHLKHAEAAPQPAQHHRIETDLLSAVGHADAHKSGLRLGGDAMKLVANRNVQPIVWGPNRLLNLRHGSLRQRQAFAYCAEASDLMNGDVYRRSAWSHSVW